MSRIGKKIINLPPKVAVKVEANNQVVVEGPKGKLEWALPRGIGLRQEADSLALTCANEKDRKQKAMFGTSRALVANMVKGVTSGFVKELEIIGVGFRAKIIPEGLDISLGFSHPVVHPIPSNLKVTVEENTKIRVEGIDKHSVGQFAAEVRASFPPEPYKGKGIRYKGEQVRKKQGKSVK